MVETAVWIRCRRDMGKRVPLKHRCKAPYLATLAKQLVEPAVWLKRRWGLETCKVLRRRRCEALDPDTMAKPSLLEPAVWLTCLQRRSADL